MSNVLEQVKRWEAQRGSAYSVTANFCSWPKDVVRPKGGH
jgi:hypothetical protein